ncbi:hypothetical protein FB45DRAFT_898233 [Roridomyces roridus]|uniref:Uncharacterized protein n=1 Tax=Roridomyces roridus TaxID=1738132 RepID=A0AAD7CCD5_9AGAR|nr:hypothetical protein FB45DRAFT_898233 [Roridomyces roridus]
MAPTGNPTPGDAELIQSCASNITSSTIVFVFFLLTFYALALWDRYLHLKLRESQRLQVDTRVYGATQVTVRPPSLKLTPPSTPAVKIVDVLPFPKDPQNLSPPPISRVENLNPSPFSARGD